MRHALPLLALLLFSLTACTGIAPMVPSEPGMPAEPAIDLDPSDPMALDRHGAATALVDVIVEGAESKNPEYVPSPYISTLPGTAGQIALYAFNAHAFPVASNTVRSKYRSDATSYGSWTYTTDGVTGYTPIYLTATEPVHAELHNSPFVGGVLNPEAAHWQGTFRTVNAEDTTEPNDDEDPVTITDRTMGSAFPNTSTLNRSFYRRTAGSLEDREDWYAMTLTAGAAHKITFTNSNGTWGNWRYDIGLYTAAGTRIANRPNITGTGTTIQLTVTQRATFYLQVVGTPLSRKGGSVYFGQYTLNRNLVPAPVVTGVTPTGTLGVSAGQATFAVTADNAPTSWSWNFGGGATPNTSTLAAPTVTLGAPGNYSGSVTASNGSGASTPFLFEYTIASTPTWTSSTLLSPRPYNVVGTVIAGKPAFASTESGGGGPGVYWYAATAVPTSASDWASCAIPATATGFARSLVDLNGKAALTWLDIHNGANDLWIVLAEIATPTVAADWTTDRVDFFVQADCHSAITVLGGKPALVWDNPVELEFGLAKVEFPTHAADWTYNVVDGATPVSGPVSLNAIDGKLAATYQTDSAELRYTRATIAAPASPDDWTSHTIGNALPAAGSHLFVAGSLPLAVFARSGESAGVYVARASSVTPGAPTDWTIHQAVSAAVTLPERWGVTQQSNRLAIAYLSGTDTANVARALVATPTISSDYALGEVMNPEAALTSTEIFGGGTRGTVLTYQLVPQLTQVSIADFAW